MKDMLVEDPLCQHEGPMLEGSDKEVFTTESTAIRMRRNIEGTIITFSEKDRGHPPPS